MGLSFSFKIIQKVEVSSKSRTRMCHGISCISSQKQNNNKRSQGKSDGSRPMRRGSERPLKPNRVFFTNLKDGVDSLSARSMSFPMVKVYMLTLSTRRLASKIASSLLWDALDSMKLATSGLLRSKKMYQWLSVSLKQDRIASHGCSDTGLTSQIKMKSHISWRKKRWALAIEGKLNQSVHWLAKINLKLRKTIILTHATTSITRDGQILVFHLTKHNSRHWYLWFWMK